MFEREEGVRYGIAFDPATKNTGVVVLQYRPDDIEFSPCYPLLLTVKPTKVDETPLWFRMAAQIKHTIDTVQPEWVATEDIYLGKNAHTFLNLAFITGVIWLHCYERGIRLLTAHTAVIDNACNIPAGLRRERRKAALRTFCKLWYRELQQDISDAAAVAFWAKTVLRREEVEKAVDEW